MQTVNIAIIYHSGKGHTEQLAGFIAGAMRTPQSVVYCLSVEEAIHKFSVLDACDCIVFGCPTYFGNVSAGFKQFMEATGSFWFRQCWKDKLATGFTISSTCSGDKLNTLESLFLFAAQHSMHWISLGVLPRFINDQQTDGQNRLASYIGLMVQCDNGSAVQPLHPGDALTAELFARRIVDTTLHFKQINSTYNETTSN